MALPAPGAPDFDDLLTRYRTARTQRPLFDVRPGADSGFDEFIDASGKVRPAWQEFAECVGERGRAGLAQLAAVVRNLVDNDGITYIPVGAEGEAAEPAPWRLDALPLVLSAADWDVLESGVVQRSRLLDAVLTDLYGPQLSVTSGVLPAQLVFAHPGYLRAARGIVLPGRHQLFLHGCDLSRAADGAFRVNADWTQAPSGAGYALADRRVVAHAIPDLYECIGPRPTSPWAQALRLALIDAAPESADEPTVVVLSPGIHSETAFDHAYLASVLGFPLVESPDLVVRDGTLRMRSMGTLSRVDVVLRRVDADYADPLDLRADSRLGVVGLVEVLRRGAVTVVNTLGSGILESPGLQRFLPELAERLLGEAPLLATPPLYWGGIGTERSHLLANLSSLLIRPVTGGAPVMGPALTVAQRGALAARIEAAPWQFVGQELPEFSSAPSEYGHIGLSAANVGLRLFTVAQRGGYAPMIGGLGYTVAPGHAAGRLTTIAAKDVWVRAPERITVERIPAADMPAPTPSPVGAVSSPRVLSDLYWTGRYAERAEHMARLLTVARERCHEFRYRREMAGSECVPVLLSAIDRVTGTHDTSADHDERVATAQSTLLALTADRHRPGSLAQSVERLGLSIRSVRDQLSNDTWLVLAAVERALLHSSAPPESPAEAESFLSATSSLTLAGMLALSGVAAESMVRDVGWTMMEVGKRLERGLNLTALLNATLTTVRSAGAEQAITESTLVVCESAVTYRRRMLGTVSMAAVAELVLFDATNPRSLAYQLDRLRAGLRALPGSSGSSRPERLVDEIGMRLRRVDPADLEDVADGSRTELFTLLEHTNHELRELSDAITTMHLSLPGGMQHLWGPGERRLLP